MKTILAIDDDIAILNLLKKFLRDQYIVETASSGQEAFDYLATHALPDLLLLDVKMPNMDGLEFKKQLNLDERYKDLPVIYLSASDHNHNRIEQKFSFDFINKPFMKDDLFCILEAFFKCHDK